MTTDRIHPQGPLNRKEREHVNALLARLDWLRQDRPDRKADPDYIPGEAGALSWALSVITGMEEPLEFRVEKMDRHIKTIYSRLGRIEAALVEEEDEDV